MKFFNQKTFIFILVSALWMNGFPKAATGKPEGKHVKILTIGNSFADNAATYLSQIAESVPGYKISVTKANLGGCSLERHVKLIKDCENDASLKPYQGKYCLRELLQMDDYDFVTIQQVSSSSFKANTFNPYASELIRYIKRFLPDAEIVIHQTWAYPNEGRLNDWKITYDEMHNRAVDNYASLASQYNLRILPVGEAFYNTYRANSDLDLWNKDRHHANSNGCYIAGCVWFGQMTDVSPKKIKYVPDGMEPKTARFLRKMANKELKKQTAVTIK